MRGKGSRRTAIVLLLLALSMLLATEPAVAGRRDRLARTRRELRAARARLASLVQDDRELLGIISGISRELRSTQASLWAARQRLALVETRIHGQERRLDQLGAQRARRAATVATRARELYMMGPVAHVEALLETSSYGDFVDKSVALSYVMGYDTMVIQDLATLQDRTRKLRSALVVQRAAETDVRNEIADREAVQSDLLGTRTEAHRKLDSLIEGERAEIAALQREQARILSLIRASGSVSTGPVSRAGFAWPIRGRITSPYGRRHGGFHTGIDIDCETGDPIGASKAGTVIAAEWGGGYGNMTIIDHGNGVTTLYAHQSRLYVSKGDRVEQRRRIGACGETGHATGSHLHFEVRVNGEHRNPRGFLP
ncbi:MAG: peptidoglycan DD-metalloendopeptidase family protein [Acidobacteria bacterium]|nr:peptidoglycan DD-metalloendopeptidase family protein [Acidobacteriota bacterium]